MKVTGKVTTYVKEIRMLAKEANEAALAAIALQLEGQTKANIVANDQVDTGFMLNSVYSVTSRDSTYGDTMASGPMQNVSGEYVERKMAPEVKVGPGEGAVAVGAEYAVFQEAKKSFLLRAAEQVAQQVGAIVEPIYAEVVHD